MSDTVVHNIKIAYDESDERVRNFIAYLKSIKMRDEIRKYHDEALRGVDKKINIVDDEGNEFTLTCADLHLCTLRLRGM